MGKRRGSWSKCDESGSKKSDDGDSQEELDGDSFCLDSDNLEDGFVTTRKIRCSARVQEKQEKLRREASPSKQVVPGEVACPGSCGHGATNISCIKGKLVTTVDDLCLPIAPETPPSGVPVGSEAKRKKRTWELWSQYDKQLFFEALNEFGKDFDAIQSHLALKLKSKNKTVEPTQIKKKEQVRHFYYRTWNKIQKYLHFPKDMKKVFQELYGLVNYGELRKKQRALNGKTAAKLLELVEKGSTTIKVKGKTQRVKTPVCQALKKINNLTDVEHKKVPTKVAVELLPKDGDTWKAVQSLSHNPRVKSLVLLQRTLASIIIFLEQRWKSSADRIKEQMMTTFGKRGVKHLRLVPSCVRPSNIPIYKAYDTASSAKISLNAYSSNVLNKVKKEGYVKLVDVEKRKRKKSGSGSGCGPENASDSVAEADCSDLETSQEKDTKDEGLKAFSSVATQFIRKTFGDEIVEDVGELSAQQLGHLLQSMRNKSTVVNSYDSQDEELDNDNNGDNDHCITAPHFSEDCRQLEALAASNCLCIPKEDKIVEPDDIFSTIIDDEIIKRGWTAEEAGSLTIGEVYLLVGSNEKISFEYEWEEDEEDAEVKLRKSRVMLDRLIAVARNLKKKKQARHKIVSGQLVALPSSSSCPSCGHNLAVPSSLAGPSLTPSTINPELLSSTPAATTTAVAAITASSLRSPTIMTSYQAGTIQQQPSNVSTEVADSSISSISATILPASSQTHSITGGQLNENLELTVKVKKITPTLVSPCTGAILTGVPLKTDLMDTAVKATTFHPPPPPKESVLVEETFRKPPAKGSANGSTPTFTHIRPAPPTITLDNNKGIVTSEDSPRNIVKNAPKPFTLLPKGNRRLGRPCCKKNIVPRYLPLLPKASETLTSSNHQPLWDVGGNKPSVHTLYNTAQLMLPVTNMSLSPSSMSLPSGNAIGCEKDDATPTEAPTTEQSNLIPLNIIKTSSPAPNHQVSQMTESTTVKILPNPNDNSVTSSNFQDLLKVSGIGIHESEKAESNLSLSSFMDISLPESTRNVATDCLKSGKYLDVTLGSSNCSLSLSTFLNSADSNNGLTSLERHGDAVVKDGLEKTHNLSKSVSNELYQSPSSSNLLSSHQQWLGSDGCNDLSLGSLLNNLEPVQPVNDMNFQSIIDDSNNHLDFTSKFSELVAELQSSSGNNKKK